MHPTLCFHQSSNLDQQIKNLRRYQLRHRSKIVSAALQCMFGGCDPPLTVCLCSIFSQHSTHEENINPISSAPWFNGYQQLPDLRSTDQ